MNNLEVREIVRIVVTFNPKFKFATPELYYKRVFKCERHGVKIGKFCNICKSPLIAAKVPFSDSSRALASAFEHKLDVLLTNFNRVYTINEPHVWIINEPVGNQQILDPLRYSSNYKEGEFQLTYSNAIRNSFLNDTLSNFKLAEINQTNIAATLKLLGISLISLNQGVILSRQDYDYEDFYDYDD